MSKKGDLLAIEPAVEGHTVKTSSDRSFGLLIAGASAFFGLWPLIHHQPVRWWLLAIAAAFLLVALVFPRILAPLNYLWLQLSRVLNLVMTPIIMALLFFLVVTPTGALLRLFGGDLLRLRKAPDQDSYWILRAPPGPDPKSMTDQF